MAQNLADVIETMTDIQRKAVNWDDGPLLILAGPGSGKTRVLTCRIARLLETYSDDRFRILGLTFTNKAAHEMRMRVAELVADADDRAEINTFHGFCAQLLRQHGVHCGINPNFEIYSRTADRQAVLEDALRRTSNPPESDNSWLLRRIDYLKERMVEPEECTSFLQNTARLNDDVVEQIRVAYRLYEEELARSNALDFNSLIFHAFKLLDFPALSRHYRAIYRYWLIDEFQDMNGPQYKLIRRMAGDNFRQLFAVADDDQTIHEWRGANVRRIRTLVDDFGCSVIQFTDNFRCPPGVVDAANRLVVYNVQRIPSKRAATAVAQHVKNENEIVCYEFSDDRSEASYIATEIAKINASDREKTAVLGRSHAILKPMQKELDRMEIPMTLLGRRDDFSSPQMRCIFALFRQVNRPLDRRNLVALTEAFADLSNIPIEIEDVIMRSEVGQITLLSAWINLVREVASAPVPIVEEVVGLASASARFTEVVDNAVECFRSDHGNSDLKDNLSVWRRIKSDIRQSRGPMPFDQFLQEMQLRSKELLPAPGSVSMGTVHAAKGSEFDSVYLIGLAEEIFPSWHSVKNDNSAAIEEDRRSCFVAITRTRHRLILSRARSYEGWTKEPSRFLVEMGLLGRTISPQDVKPWR